jgi:hypothetical protein
MTISKTHKYLVLTVLMLAVSGCAQHYTGATYSDPYGIFSGLLHGLVFPFALIANIISWALSIIGISIFTDIQLVGRPNTGFLFYYVGYFLGLCLWNS